MKNGLKIAFVYIGLVIGAGFASGQEIMQYFNPAVSGRQSSIIFAGVCFILIAYLILNKTYRDGITSFDEYVSLAAGRLAPLAKIFFTLFMFCGFFVMLAGSGALIKNIFDIGNLAGIVLTSAVCFVVFAFDVKGIVALNTVLVPLMIFGVSALCLMSLMTGVTAFAPLDRVKALPAARALCYVSYNTITAGAVLVPLYRLLSRKSIRIGAALGGGILGLLIFLVWSVAHLHYEVLIGSEIPLYMLAEKCGTALKWVYSAVLLMAICTTATSHGFGLLSVCPIRSAKERLLFAAVLCLIAIPFATLGFSALVEHLYSFFGYAGLIWLFAIVWDFLRGIWSGK